MTASPRSRWRQSLTPTRLDLSIQDKFTPEQRRAITGVEILAQALGTVAAILRYGLRDLTRHLEIELGAVVVASLLTLLVTLIIRDRASLALETFRARYRFRFTLLTIWLAISATILIVGPDLLGLPSGTTRLSALFLWSDAVILIRTGAAAIGVTRGVSAGALSPALLLISTFAVLITVGTLLLLLPRCRVADAPDQSWPDRVRIAAFTATSASCVTGLVVVPTGGPDAYWSRTGQLVILVLFQIGGLGIMTCGAFFALTSSRSFKLRESATLREMFDHDSPVNLRWLLVAIIIFTFGSELLGAFLLSGLWPEKPPAERAFFSVFYAVSAFCNAGFDLTGHSLLGEGRKWQVWGVMAYLVVIGGLGFGTLYNLAIVATSRFRRTRPDLFAANTQLLGAKLASGSTDRLTITTRLILITTATLLIIGTAWSFFFEAMPGGTLHDLPLSQRLADSWFQSVVSRTAGFNTVDLAQLRPATKLFDVGLMFVGAAPVSTGGGIKVTTLAVVFLALIAILRGRPQAEAFGRTIPDAIVKRALTIMALGGATLMSVTLLLAAFENNSTIETIDLLYEATSACATVGVSTGITSQLTVPSQVVLIIAMFLGRIGPLTLLLGLAGQRQTQEYSYPDERVTLG